MPARAPNTPEDHILRAACTLNACEADILRAVRALPGLTEKKVQAIVYALRDIGEGIEDINDRDRDGPAKRDPKMAGCLKFHGRRDDALTEGQ